MSESRAGEEDTTQRELPVTARAAAIAACVLGCTGLIYWVPALWGAAPGLELSPRPIAIIQRVASLALEQYTAPMKVIVPILGVLGSVASALQIPAAIGTLRRRESAMALLRGLAYAKVALYVAAGLLLGLALFSSVQPNRPWTLAALNWLAVFVMIAFYYWVARVMSVALARFRRDPDPLLPEEAEDESDASYPDQRYAGL